MIPLLMRRSLPGDIGRAAVSPPTRGSGCPASSAPHRRRRPALAEAAGPGARAELIHRMEAPHDRVEELVAALAAALTRWEAEAQPGTSEEVAADIDELRAALVEHLDDEEGAHPADRRQAACGKRSGQPGQHGMAKVREIASCRSCSA